MGRKWTLGGRTLGRAMGLVLALSGPTFAARVVEREPGTSYELGGSELIAGGGKSFQGFLRPRFHNLSGGSVELGHSRGKSEEWSHTLKILVADNASPACYRVEAPYRYRTVRVNARGVSVAGPDEFDTEVFYLLVTLPDLPEQWIPNGEEASVSFPSTVTIHSCNSNSFVHANVVDGAIQLRSIKPSNTAVKLAFDYQIAGAPDNTKGRLAVRVLGEPVKVSVELGEERILKGKDLGLGAFKILQLAELSHASPVATVRVAGQSVVIQGLAPGSVTIIIGFSATSGSGKRAAQGQLRLEIQVGPEVPPTPTGDD
ncbi:MAG: hypothetical protein AB7O52_04170 [Planctomycetota bacterium]